jgi:protein ImuB
MDRQPMSKPSDLYACLYAKELPLQALMRLRPEMRGKPCAVLAGEPPMQQVCSLNASARTLGITHGMTRVELDTFPAIAVLLRSLAEEETARAVLLECTGAFSPRVEDQSTAAGFLCVIDIAGTEKLLGNPHALGKKLLQRIKSLGIKASIAISSNFHAAISIARGMVSVNQVSVIPSGEESSALAPLPLAVLDLSEAHAETFALWGIHTLGMLAELPEKALIARIGQEGKRLRQLARGELPHLFRPIEPPFSLIERIDLDTPVELLDSLLFVIAMMLDQLILRATARIFALASVTVTLALEGGTQYQRTVRPALPTNFKQLWIKLIHLDLEAHPPQAAILSLTLSAEHGVPSKVQLGLFSPQLPEAMRLDVTLARIRAIVGEDHVGHAQLKDTHRQDGFSVEAFTISLTQSRSSKPQSQTIAKQPREALQRTSTRHIRPAEHVPVALRGKQPETFCFRGTWYRVEHAYGPWRASGDWWNPTLWCHDQWDLVARADKADGGSDILCCCLVHDLSQSSFGNPWTLVALYD